MKVRIEKTVEGLALDRVEDYGCGKEDVVNHGVFVYSDENGWFLNGDEDVDEAIKHYDGDLKKMLSDISKSLAGEVSNVREAARADIEALWLEISELKQTIAELQG